MIKLSLKIGICTTFMAHSVIGMEKPGGELLNILETAMRNPLAAKALNEEKSFREKTIRQIEDLRDNLEKIKGDRDLEAWQKRILAQIQKDEEIAKALDEALKPFQSGISVRYSVKTNKTLPILEGVKTLLTESFFDLADGKIPVSYKYNQQTVTILGGENKTSIWGNSRGTYLKATLLYMLANQDEGTSKTFGSMGLPWFDDSALAHVAPLPDEITLDLSSYSFACSYEHQVKRGLVLPHSGYAFGGHRSEERYSQGKKFGPQDCSSWVGSFMGSPIYTTADQLCAYRKLANVSGLVPPGWEEGSDARYLLDNMEVAVVKDPSKDIKAGQIYWVRRFASTDPDMTQTLGSGGHTALALGYLRDGNIVTIGYNRDMPSLEGFGIQNFSWAPEPLKIKGLFNVKGF